MKNWKKTTTMAMTCALTASLFTGYSSVVNANLVGVQDLTPAADTTVIVDSMTIGSASAWENLTPFRTDSASGILCARMMYDTLARLVEGGDIIPQAAKTWEVEEDGVTWNVEIYDYIHDEAGNKITASDIAWMINETKAQAMRPAFSKVVTAEATGDYTLKITMSDNMIGSFESVLTGTYVVSQKAYEESEDGFVSDIIATGPYSVTDFVSGSSITLEKKADYWQTDDMIDKRLANNIENVVFKYITEPSQQQIALETGEVDAFAYMDASLAPMIQANDQTTLCTTPMMLGCILSFSGDESKVVANDVNLRKAIAYAIDEQGLISGVYSNLGIAMNDSVNDNAFGYNPDWKNEPYFEYDLEKAKELVAASDYNGEELEFMATSSTRNERMLTMMQAYLAEAGINMKLKLVDRAYMAGAMNNGKEYDGIIVNTGGVYLPQYWVAEFDGTAFSDGDARGRKDETLTQMIKETSGNSGFTTENINKIHDYINEQMYAYGTCQPLSCDAHNANINLTGYVISGNGGIDFIACTYGE